MISEDSLKEISHIFCGDIEGYYSYKRGIDLVSFFNRYYRAGDVYQQGFPSRWAYVYDKIMSMLNINTADSFFDIILGKEYLIRDLGITEVEAAEKSEEILAEFNRIVGKDLCKITHSGGHYHLIRET